MKTLIFRPNIPLWREMHNQRINLTGKSYAPIVATFLPLSYPFHWA